MVQFSVQICVRIAGGRKKNVYRMLNQNVNENLNSNLNHTSISEPLRALRYASPVTLADQLPSIQDMRIPWPKVSLLCRPGKRSSCNCMPRRRPSEAISKGELSISCL